MTRPTGMTSPIWLNRLSVFSVSHSVSSAR
jgi:hypothetical protein